MQLRAGINQTVSLLHERSPHGQILRFIFFLVLYFLARYPQLLLDNTSFGKALFSPIHEQLSFFITNACCYVLQIFYPGINTSIHHTIFIGDRALIQMYPGCTGLYPMIRLTIILAFYPLAWRRKVVLWPLSLLILLFASTLHFLLLILIANQCPGWFGFAHNWLTRVIFYAFYFLCWLLWEKAIPLWRTM
jgi:exosortase/archaeosortase family protein